MSIMFSRKVFSGVMTDGTNTWYSDMEQNGALGSAEKYHFELKASGVNGAAPTIGVVLETSTDNVNWDTANPRAITGLAAGTSIPAGANTVVFGYELGTAKVGGRFARLNIKLGVVASSAYIEIWATGRTAV